MVSLTTAATLLVGFLGLVLLVKGAQTAVGASIRLAKHYDVPDALVGVTIVAIGTSLPEVGANVIASFGILSGTLDPAVASATVLGGNMGSTITQQLLLFGIFLLGFGHYHPSARFVRWTLLPMVAASILVLVLALDGHLSRAEGGILLVGYAAYTYHAISTRERSAVPPEPASRHVWRDVGITVLGLAAVLVGAFVVLEVVETVVDQLALGGSMIGLVTIGLAAALPELSTVLEALRRRTPDLAIGTLVGSNIVNPLLAIGLGSAISTYQVPEAVVVWDLPVRVVAGVGILAWLRFVSGGSLGRREGLYLVVAYLVFVSGRLLLFAGQ
ncbi:sodium:calcium antiporter [Haloarchaeobius sp. TZWWS8]|uniref:sodium:calcium antiporter n=1 Tax=Haloarchaeobius sp. TZWWS8 TaxID=3446121 RepID=UPI003EBC2D5B